MQKLPLIGGSYTARSALANCQQCINLFPELNREDSPSQVTHYQRPGLLPLVSPVAPAPGRLIYQCSNGDGYCVIGSGVYYISPPPAWTLTQIGTISAGRSNPCSLTDNGIATMLVDGSNNGWTWSLASKGADFALIVDSSFGGADKVDFIDTFILWNVPGTDQFQSTLSNQITPLDPLYIASKTDYPDPLQSLIINRHEILLLGLFKSELWYDAGNPQFPFAELPGAYVEHGLGAKYSLASADISVYWLGRDLQSSGTMIFRQRGYECKAISNPAISLAMRQMREAGADLSDAVGYTYQQDGHVFYVLSFVSGNQTWVWDESIGDPMQGWSQRCWSDGNGVLNRDRTNGAASLYGYNVAIDWENGTLYSLDLNTYTDTVAGEVGPIVYLRTFPHLMSGVDPKSGQAVLANGRMVQHSRFLLDATVGTGPVLDANNSPPKFTLKYSDDRGVTWSTPDGLEQSAGEQGKYQTRAEWAGLGQAMDRVYQLSWSFPGPVALNGAWVEGAVLAR